MHPELIRIFGYPLHAYPTMLAVAFVAGTLLAVREADRRGLVLPPELGIWAFLGALVGAKAFYILQYGEVAQLWRALLIWQGGLVYYGGFIGGLSAAYAYARICRLPILRTADVAAPYLALGQAITRVGCFLNGCCYGVPTNVPWAVTFPPHSHAHERQVAEGVLEAGAAHTLPVHPTQLYMVFGLLATAVVLKLALDRRRFAGQNVLHYAFLYGVLRFVVEWLRGDSARSVMGMTVSQAISLALLLLGAGLLGWAIVSGLWQRAPLQTRPTAGEPTTGD
jgi:phosphatidylglycerol:prolipoprotein diacylglycerol transferase